MTVKYRSTTFRCDTCGSCHTYYGKDADEIININSVLCDLSMSNDFWDKNFSDIGVMELMESLAKCCENPKYLHWDRSLREVFRVQKYNGSEL